MENTIYQSFSEVYDIINHMEEDCKAKIPNKFIKMLYEKRDINYKVNIDYSKNINEQKLLAETRALLSIIYRKYIR